MKREFRPENFEDFLKRNADNLRMKAPEKVWENLSKRLTRERRRFSAGLSAFLLLTGLLGYLSISTTKQVHVTKQETNSAKNVAVPGKIERVSRNNASMQSRLLLMAAVNNNTSPSGEIADGSKILTAAAPQENTIAQQPQLSSEQTFIPTIVDDNPVLNDRNPDKNPIAAKPPFLQARNDVPWSIESVINSYRPKPHRLQTEFHFTPTISYRKLTENKSYLRTTSLLNSPPNFAALYGSVNSMVTHKPDLGFEVGVTEKYSLTKKLIVRAGLQFNVNRYDIKAFSAPYTFTPIALRSSSSSRVDSIWTLTNYSNVSNNTGNAKTNWLQNFSFQVSAPVGVELALAGNEKTQFGIATTVQPTYVLGDRAYLITTNYKSYTQVPWLLRRWNVNTAFETFVSYQSGRTKWQVGPQVRYQLLSSFISNYPVKENLFDFGLKIGVSIIK